MKEKPSKKNNTLVIILILLSVCVLFVVCIMGIIFSLGLFGVGVAQKSSRDLQRKTVLADISLSIVSYYEVYGDYPKEGDLKFYPDKVVLYRNGEEYMAVNLPGVAKANGSNSQGETSSEETRYCYGWRDEYYILGAFLESGEWFEFGNDTTENCQSKYGN